MTEIMAKTYSLLFENLVKDSPVLSGNMKRHIKIKSIDDHKIVIELEAPFYDVKTFMRTGQIIYLPQDKYVASLFKKDRVKKVGTGKFKGVIDQEGRYKVLYSGITNYAYWLNQLGAFGKHNGSKNWVNRSCKRTCDIIANEYKADVDNHLPL